MKRIKVGAAVLNQTPLNWEGNLAHILESIEEARRQRVSILCLPELCLTGYGCEDAFHGVGMTDVALELLQSIVPATKNIIVAVGLPVLHQNAVFNTACLVANGRILGFVAKRFLAGDGIHYEPRWFKPWPEGLRTQLRVRGETYPLGDLYFCCGGVKIGFEICEDAWVATRPGGQMAHKGVDIILNPSASHFAFGKSSVRERFVVEGSRAFGVVYVYSNLLGNDAGRAIYDGGAMIASRGQLLARGQRFSFADHGLVTAVADVETNRMYQARTASFRPDLRADAGQWERSEFAYPESVEVSPPLTAEPWESSNYLKEEEFTRAVALALYDYLRKSYTHGFVVSLSGGADSAAVACLVFMSVQLGVRELGLDGFLQKLRYSERLFGSADEQGLMKNLLTCVYQATRNSSKKTGKAARKLATGLHADFIHLDVGDLVDGYTKLVEDAIGTQLDWEKHDIPLQNIQARARAPGVWLLANLRHALLLATSNRSEAAVGYATMDGDTCGGLSPIAGIDKAFLLSWLRWLECTGPQAGPAVPALSAVNGQKPTAELRPLDVGQTDEEDLMPYDVLDAIERLAIRDKHPPLSTWRLVVEMFPGHKELQVALWVERFFRLWCRNQWKRDRYAPSFHLDDENLDPKTWCRFPILSGNFSRELKEMLEHVAKHQSEEVVNAR